MTAMRAVIVLALVCALCSFGWSLCLTRRYTALAAPAKSTVHSPVSDPLVSPPPVDDAGAAFFTRSGHRTAGKSLETSSGGKPGSGVSTLAAANLHLAPPDYQPTRERFLDMGRTMAALEPEELWDLPEDFWERWPQYEFLRHSWRSGTLSEALGAVVDPVAELERLWPQSGVQALWVEHCAAAWERANLDHAPEGKWKAERLEAIERRLFALRSDLWARAGETYLWLFEVGQER